MGPLAEHRGDALAHLRHRIALLPAPMRATRAATLEAELDASEVHVREQLTTMHRDAIVIGVEEWTATKLLRRLAWHERGELDAVDLLLASWNGPESTR